MSDELSPREVAERLGASPRSVQRWIASGRLPARRVGGRWRVASDAIDAFMARSASGRTARRPSRPTRIRTLFIANRGEIADRITRTCERLGIRAVVPGHGRPERPRPARSRGRRGGGRWPPAPTRSIPASGSSPRTPTFAERSRGCRDPLGRASALGDPRDGRQGGRASAGRLARHPGPARLRRRRTSRDARSWPRRRREIGFPLLVKPAAGGGGKGMRTVREPGRLPRGAGRRAARSDRRVRRRSAHPRAPARGRPPRRDPGPVRRARPRRPPGRTRLLDPAPPPEGARGVAVTGRRCRPPRTGWAVAALRLARRVGYVNAGTCEFLVDDAGRPGLPRDEHAAPGRAPGDRAGDRSRPRRGPAPDRGRRAARVRQRGRSVRPVTPSRSDCMPRTPRPASCRRPVGSNAPLAVRRGDPGRCRDRSGHRDRRPVRPDAGQDRGLGPRPRRRPSSGWPARSTRPSSSALITNLRFLRWLVRQPVVLAGEARDGHARSDLAAGRLGRPDRDPGRGLADGRGSPAPRLGEPADPWAGGWRLNAAPTLALDAEGLVRSVPLDPAPPLPSEPDAFEVVRRRRHRPRRSGGSEHGLPHRAAARRRRDGPCGGRPRPRERQRSGRARRPDARRGPARPCRGRCCRGGRRPGRHARGDEDGARRRRLDRGTHRRPSGPRRRPGDARAARSRSSSPDRAASGTLRVVPTGGSHGPPRTAAGPAPDRCRRPATSCSRSIARRAAGATPRRTAARSTSPRSTCSAGSRSRSPGSNGRWTRRSSDDDRARPDLRGRPARRPPERGDADPDRDQGAVHRPPRAMPGCARSRPPASWRRAPSRSSRMRRSCSPGSARRPGVRYPVLVPNERGLDTRRRPPASMRSRSSPRPRTRSPAPTSG